MKAKRLAIMRGVLGWLAAAIGAAFLIAAAGALIPVNRDWVEPDRGIAIYVESNGIHTGLVLPMRAAGVDWSELVRPDDLADPRYYGTHLLFGWGNRDVYLNVPRWRDLTPGVALGAVFGGGDGLVHVDHEYAPEPTAMRRRIIVSPAQYRILADHVRESFVLDAQGRAQPLRGRGYGPADSFYEGSSGYTLANSCNEWTARGLRKAGIRTGLWAPFADGVMRWVPGAD